jgi:phosphatidylcholine synthase
MKMTTTQPPVVTASAADIRRGWMVHVFTTAGVIVGMLALEAVFSGKPRGAIVYLLITQLIDGIDGPIARQIDIVKTIPKIDGYVLDLVIDYVTCVVVPAAFMHRFHMLPKPFSLAIVCLVVFLSAMWFSRTDMMTEDNWFRGFPSTWNLVVPTMFVMGMGKWPNAIATLLLCALLMSNVQVPHPVRVPVLRPLSLGVTLAWLGALLWATLNYRIERVSNFGKIVMIPAIGYFIGLSVWRARQLKEQRKTAEPDTPAEAV